MTGLLLNPRKFLLKQRNKKLQQRGSVDESWRALVYVEIVDGVPARFLINPDGSYFAELNFSEQAREVTIFDSAGNVLGSDKLTSLGGFGMLRDLRVDLLLHIRNVSETLKIKCY